MGLYVNTNSSALNAQRNLNGTSRTLARSFSRLSSGLRINSAKDDAAGLAISDRMTSQINGINQAIRNTNDGMSLAQTAEGGLQETTNILQRMRELSVQAANDTNTSDDRQSIQQEMDQLTSELDRIAEKTTFNNQNILDGSFAGAKFHVGANSNDTITVNVKDARAGSLGRMARLEIAEVGEDALSTGVNGISLKSKDSNFYVVRQTSSTDDAISFDDKDSSAIAKAAAINDSTKFHGVTATATKAEVNLGAITAGAVDGAQTMTINGEVLTGLTIQNDDADGTLVDAINAITDKTGVVATIASDKGLVLTAEDGRNITVNDLSGRVGGAAMVAPETTYGGLTLQADNNITVGDAVNPTGAIDATVLADTLGAQAVENIGANTDFAVDKIDVTDREGANRAIEILDVALEQVAESRSGLGAVQNRMESTVRNLEVAGENLSASRSRILDADFAQETAAFSRNQIMQQAGISVLAQANQQPQIALALLS